MKRKLITLLTIVCMLCTMSVPVFGAENTNVSDASKLNNPKMTEAKPAVWDCVWFGHYPQSKVETSNAVYKTLEASSNWDANNDIEINGDKYHRIETTQYVYDNDSGVSTEAQGWDYYQYDSIKWRVLSVDGDEALLLADKALDEQAYSEESSRQALI